MPFHFFSTVLRSDALLMDFVRSKDYFRCCSTLMIGDSCLLLTFWLMRSISQMFMRTDSSSYFYLSLSESLISCSSYLTAVVVRVRSRPKLIVVHTLEWFYVSRQSSLQQLPNLWIFLEFWPVAGILHLLQKAVIELFLVVSLPLD